MVFNEAREPKEEIKMKNILKGKSFKEIKDEAVEKIDDFANDHYILVTSMAGAIVGSFTALCMCIVYKNAYSVGLNEGVRVCNKMIKELANMPKESK